MTVTIPVWVVIIFCLGITISSILRTIKLCMKLKLRKLNQIDNSDN